MADETRTWLKQLDVAESLGWCVEVFENGETLIENYSPAGEDLVFYIDIEESFVDGVKRLAADFDPDEHVELWIEGRGKNGVPSSVRELVEDADKIKQMLQELADALEKMV